MGAESSIQQIRIFSRAFYPFSVFTKGVNHGVKYIAFPAISCGVYGYPYDEAAEVSVQALQDSAGQLSEVHFVLFEAGTYSAWLAEAKKKLERLPA
jgi:O-acetyl-ADP-ribose deacetylase (regulator of RNase III)